MLTFGIFLVYALIFLLFVWAGDLPEPHVEDPAASLSGSNLHRDAMFGYGIGLDTGLGLFDPLEAQRRDEELRVSQEFTDYTFLNDYDRLNPHTGVGMGFDHADNSMFSGADHMGGTDSSYHSMDS